MKMHSIEEIETMAHEITQDISDRIESLKEHFGPETWADLNKTWGEIDKEISSKEVEVPNWSLDDMLAMEW